VGTVLPVASSIADTGGEGLLGRYFSVFPSKSNLLQQMTSTFLFGSGPLSSFDLLSAWSSLLPVMDVFFLTHALDHAWRCQVECSPVEFLLLFRRPALKLIRMSNFCSLRPVHRWRRLPVSASAMRILDTQCFRSRYPLAFKGFPGPRIAPSLPLMGQDLSFLGCFRAALEKGTAALHP